MTIFIRLIGEVDKEEALAKGIAGFVQGRAGHSIFELSPDIFDQMPWGSFCYDLPRALMFGLVDKKSLESCGRESRNGLATLDDFRFLRNWDEVHEGSPKYVDFIKSGGSQPYAPTISYKINWGRDGLELKTFVEAKVGAASRKIQGEKFYFRSGITWPRRPHKYGCFHAMPSGVIFDTNSPCLFSGDVRTDLAIAAILNSNIFHRILHSFMPRGLESGQTLQYESGYIVGLPFPDLTRNQEAALATLARRAWSIKRGLDSVVETSHAFTLPALLADLASAGGAAAGGEITTEAQRHREGSGADGESRCGGMDPRIKSGGDVESRGDGGADPAQPGTASLCLCASVVQQPSPTASLQERAAAWAAHVAACDAAVADVQARIDDMAFDLYGIDGEDRAAVEAFDARKPQAGATADEPDDEDEDEDEESLAAIPAEELAAQLLSWAVGVAFGRFDIRLALGTRPLPPEPDPFDPLPALSPGMLAEAGEDYPLSLPEDGLLVDDDGQDLDLIARVRAVFDHVFPGVDHFRCGVSRCGVDPLSRNSAEARWQEVAHLVGCADGDPRAWFRRTFFPWHVKRYSKSRRKAPVYWQFSVPSGRFSVWLWYHKATPDTFHRIAGLVERKIAAETRRLDQMLAEAGDRPGPSARKLLDEQEGFVEELRTLHDEVRRVAALWAPDFDDGVIINFAPLWRLVPHAKTWQKEARACWDKLADGAYDWSALARRLWPERVAEKCRSDRSLSIAHGVEDEFWMQDEDDKWVPRPEPLVSVDALVARWRSNAVADALDGLEAAPIPESRSRPRAVGGGARRPAGPSQDAIDAVRKALSVAIDGLATRELAERIGLPEGECKAALDVLSKIGDAEKRGAGRGTRWYAASGGENQT